MSAVVHEIGKLQIPEDVKKTTTEENAKEIERTYERNGHAMIEDLLFSTPSIKRTASQAFQLREELEEGKDISHMKLTKSARVLASCDLFDSLTAMSLTEEPETLVGALKEIRKNEQAYGKDITDAFIDSIYFLPEGSSVELTNGVKGLIIAANDYDIFKPVVLTYHDNRLIDLRRTDREGPEIMDIVKKFDSRYVIEREVITAAKENIE